MNAPQTQVAIGIDVGGTAIKAGLVGADGRVYESRSIPTDADRGPDHVIARIVEVITQSLSAATAKGYDVEAVGLGVPGTLDRAAGVVVAPPNLPGWRNVPIVERLTGATGLRIVLENDANNAALGEYYCGAGRGVSDMVMLTLGTGIGGGIILSGRLWRGALGNGGEIGHVIIQAAGRPCGCGQRGCLEAYASATATVARAMERIRAGEPSVLARRTDSADLSVEMIIDAAQRGDGLAADVWRETCRYLAIGCVNIHHMINPERIVLAGGMSHAGDPLLGGVAGAVSELASPMLGCPPEIRLAEIGNDAGFIGSALSVFRPER